MSYEWFLWGLAAVSAAAVSLALASMTRGWKAKVFALGVFPLAISAVMVLRSTARGIDPVEALHIFILCTLDLALMRLVFAGWIRRQWELYDREGRWAQTSAGQLAVFFAAFITGLAVLGASLWGVEEALY
ncbi:hypothetical protein [Nocardiopsis suaedae]|uniref:Uncharacterized protein n=1 Tax=Nocardiopsis suaedae TaxID=3018444 RepID=A0ABT4TJL1_9ACTN|nr:hypothetical protein [Nocardiopsis suaedae]MDA2804888.1 hypothetical protein [Nocardiopsis suaedae]